MVIKLWRGKQKKSQLTRIFHKEADMWKTGWHDEVDRIRYAFTEPRVF